MRRFTFIAQPCPVSGEDLQGKCRRDTQGHAGFALEYERILRETPPKKAGLPVLPCMARKGDEPAEKRARPIRVTPVKGIADDFYSSLLDWQGNSIVFALDERVFVQNFLTGRVFLLARLNNTYVTSVKICPLQNLVAVGTCTGEAAVIDIEGKFHTRRHQHKSRIGVLAWSNGKLLSGSRDRAIRQLDIRERDRYTPPVVVHTQEVCGLAFSSTNAYLASGGNDNQVCILDSRSHSSVLHTITAHKAAVKALGWCPDRADVLATGGGTADRTVKIWKVSGAKEKMMDSIKYGSQVCNLKWTKNHELLTTHGYSQNDVRVLDVARHRPVRIYEGHKNRVIHFGMSQEEEYFATGSGDETLCVWRARENNLANYLVR